MAIGQAQFLKADMVRPGAVVIDVGINRLPDGKLVRRRGFRRRCAQVASAHHARARRRRADDDHHAAAQHAAGGPDEEQ